jgi:diadenosine tetraphosphate (Ap4A) HIT family hydrolase
MRQGSDMDFGVARFEHFDVAHCFDCVVPGYLIVSPIVPALSLGALSQNAQEELGSVLAAVTQAIQTVIAPVKIYCAQFGEESPQIHFHVFPRTEKMTAEFIIEFPQQRELVHGPIVLDWARTRYRGPKSDVFAAVSSVIPALQVELSRITSGSTRSRVKRAPD